jgi:endonuclease-3
MARGVTPRRPAKTGRHEGARPKPGQPRKALPKLTNRPQLPVPKSPAKPKGYDPTAPARVAEILKRLDQLYPDVTCALTHKDAWELVVATILSAQSTDVRVNIVTPELFKKYPTVQDFAKLEPQQLEQDIRSTGFFRNKSKSVVGAARKIVNDFGGKVPENMEDLLTLPGVARKTANVVLGTWFKIAEGLVVDTHVHRVSRRLELTKNDDHSPRQVDSIFAPADLARERAVFRAISEVRGLSSRKYLPCRGQDVEHGGEA